jgi:hypothetical protein
MGSRLNGGLNSDGSRIQGDYGIEGRAVEGNLFKVAHSTGGAGSSLYRDFGGHNGRVHFGSLGDGDFYYSNGSTFW